MKFRDGDVVSIQSSSKEFRIKRVGECVSEVGDLDGKHVSRVNNDHLKLLRRPPRAGDRLAGYDLIVDDAGFLAFKYRCGGPVRIWNWTAFPKFEDGTPIDVPDTQSPIRALQEQETDEVVETLQALLKEATNAAREAFKARALKAVEAL